MASLRKKPNSRNWVACFLDATGKPLQRTTGIADTGSPKERALAKKKAMEVARAYEEAARGDRTEAQIRKTVSDLFSRNSEHRLEWLRTDEFLRKQLERVKERKDPNTCFEAARDSMTAFTSVRPDPVSAALLRESSGRIKPASLSDAISEFWHDYQKLWWDQNGKQWLSDVSEVPLQLPQRLDWQAKGIRCFAELLSRISTHALTSKRTHGIKREAAIREWGLRLRTLAAADGVPVAREWFGWYLSRFQDDPDAISRWSRLRSSSPAHPQLHVLRLVAIAWDHATPIPLRYFSRSAILGVINEWLHRRKRRQIHPATLKLDILGPRSGLRLSPERPWFISVWERGYVGYRPETRGHHESLPFLLRADLEAVYKRRAVPK